MPYLNHTFHIAVLAVSSSGLYLPPELWIMIYNLWYMPTIRSRTHPFIRCIYDNIESESRITYKIYCALKSIIINVKRQTVEQIIRSYNECNCCERHSYNKPFGFAHHPYEYTTHVYASEKEHEECIESSNCDCRCRHLARLCAHDTSYGYGFDFSHELSLNMYDIKEFIRRYGRDEGRKRWIYSVNVNLYYVKYIRDANYKTHRVLLSIRDIVQSLNSDEPAVALSKLREVTGIGYDPTKFHIQEEEGLTLGDDGYNYYDTFPYLY